MESVGLRNEIKVCCAKALWKLSTWSLLICKKVTEKKGGVLQFSCLMAVMEIAVVAESNADLRE
ncbi:hypothetical protein Lalb_Chr07g0182951 [Lupinus albus]|uniref:Uncharacterized protein n=1 Tax=Lupinus albus TaxID=3870 RepID=A0A6A4Q9T3_LUPAL|nr:hypothetical protein Lalb_Chr07g0182951 [Lupinus albus]